MLIDVNLMMVCMGIEIEYCKSGKRSVSVLCLSIKTFFNYFYFLHLTFSFLCF